METNPYQPPKSDPEQKSVKPVPHWAYSMKWVIALGCLHFGFILLSTGDPFLWNVGAVLVAGGAGWILLHSRRTIEPPKDGSQPIAKRPRFSWWRVFVGVLVVVLTVVLIGVLQPAFY